MRSTRKLSAVAACVTLVIIGAGCGQGDGNNNSNLQGPTADQASLSNGIIGLEEATGKPRSGGTVTFAVYAEALTLDPASQSAYGFGTTGGIELNAIYDVLIRYDPESASFEPQLAKSLEPNQDNTIWTLKLRPGVKFSDNTPLNADAVASSLKRITRMEAANADVLEPIESIETPDTLTVVFTLKAPWAGFPYALSLVPGNIVSPAAVKKLGDEAISAHPVGAGPFMLKRFAPGEELVLERNPNYWGNNVHIDSLRFIPIEGDQAKLDALRTGDIQAAFFRDPRAVEDAMESGYGGLVNIQNGAELLLINNADDAAGSDLRIRQAIAYSIDAESIVRRTYQAAGLPGTEIFQKFSRWHTDVDPIEQDLDKARELLADAKAEGFDGKLTFIADSTPATSNYGLAVEAQLESVGFDVKVDTRGDVLDRVRKVYNENWDLAYWTLGVGEAEASVRLTDKLGSDSTKNAANYSDKKMDELLSELKQVPDEESARQVIARIQRRWNETVPSVVTGDLAEFIAWSDDLHGVVPTLATEVLFHNAWLSDGG